jgi:lipopolysaccharide transport system permease protein
MSDGRLTERVYTSDAERERGMAVWRDMLADLWAARELLWRLAHRDLTVSYRQSLLGFLWALLMPLLTVMLFAYLSSMRLVPIGATLLPYPVYALWGVVLWQLFAATLSATTSSLANAGPLVTKVDFPKEVVVLSAVTRPLFEFAIKLLLVAVLMVIYDVSPGLSTWLLVPLVALTLAMALGIGLVLSLANLVVRDIGNLVGIVVMFGMFAAPVLYPPPQTEPFTLLVVLNPFSPLLMASHDLLAGNPVAHPELLGASALFALLCLGIGWRLFRVVIRRVTERA